MSMGTGIRAASAKLITRGGVASMRIMANYQNQIAAVVFMVYDY
jgi:hypothetical protein